MKEYLKKLLYLIIIAGVVIITVSGANQYCFEMSVEESDLIPKGVKILAFGDSHIECSVNDQSYPVIANRASSSEKYFYSYAKIKNLLTDERNNLDSLQCIVLSYNNFSVKNIDNMFNGGEEMSRFIKVYRTVHKYNSGISPADFGLPINDRFKKEVLKVNYRLILVDKTFINAVLKSIILFDFNILNNIADIYKGAFKDTESPYIDTSLKKITGLIGDRKDFELDKVRLNNPEIILKEIAKLTTQYNIPLVLVNAPCHESFYSGIFPELEEYNKTIVEELQQEYDVTYLDYLRMPMSDDCFRDSDHLDITGANIFTPILLDTLTQLGIYKPI